MEEIDLKILDLGGGEGHGGQSPALSNPLSLLHYCISYYFYYLLSDCLSSQGGPISGNCPSGETILKKKETEREKKRRKIPAGPA